MSIYQGFIKKFCIQNESTLEYLQICSNAQNRIKSTSFKGARKEAKSQFNYVEAHHIWPKCICESDSQKSDFANHVFLSATEHRLCHFLLTQMFDNKIKYKMYSAYTMMFISSDSNPRPPTNDDTYELAKTLQSIAASFNLAERNKRNTGLMRAINKETNKVSMIPTKEFNSITHIPYALNTVICKNNKTGESLLVQSNEFYSNSDLVGITNDQIYAKNKISGKIELCTRLNLDNGTHIHSNKDKIPSELARKNMSKSSFRKHTAIVRDFNGNIIHTSYDDPRIINLEVGAIDCRAYILISPNKNVYKFFNLGKFIKNNGFQPMRNHPILEINESLIINNKSKTKYISLNDWEITRIL